jgi:DNA-binding SARP family transcriptional activator/Tfp pilus assembly protein PilF
MVQLSIALLGPFQVTQDGNPVTEFETDLARALLAYLAMNAGTPFRRESLADLLWPDQPATKALHALRQTLNRLRSAIGDRDTAYPFLEVTRVTIQFNPGSDCWLDATAFTGLIASSKQHPHHCLECCHACMEKLQEAAGLYRGDLLAGFCVNSLPFQEWLIAEREHLHQRAMEVFYRLAAHYEQCGAYDQACHYAWQQVKLEPWREEAHQQLMRALALSGQHSAALRQYQECVQALQQELNITPQEGTTRLYLAIQENRELSPTVFSLHLHDHAPDAGQTRPDAIQHHMPFLAPPRPAHALIGREGLLGDLKRRLLEDDNVLIALQGLPGVGKTALMIELAHDTNVLAHFSDGVLWAGLGRQPDVLALLGMWATAMKVPAEEIARRTSSTERAWSIHAAIGFRRMLLVIDDAWQVDAALALKVGGPNCAHIVTTRLTNVALDFAGGGSTPVRELDIVEGVRLLAQFAPKVVCAEPEETQSLIQAVGGLPLALVLMGQHLRKVSCGTQARRVNGALAQLQATQARLQLAQPQSPLEQKPDLLPQTPLSLQASISLSDMALDAAARKSLRDLSLFAPKPNTFSEAAALAVTDAPVRVLDTLADHGFLESAGPDRYTMHQTIADYARLEGAGPEAVKRFVNHFVQYIIGHTTDDVLLDLERNNLLAALELAFNHQMHEELIRSVSVLHPFLMNRGLYAVAELHLSRALELVSDVKCAERYALLLAREKAYNVLGRREAQRQDLDILEKLAEALGDSQRRAKVSLRRANYVGAIGDYSAAIVAAQRAVELAQATQDVSIQAEGHLQWGQALWQQGDHSAARCQLEQALALVQRARAWCPLDSSRWLEAEILRHLGIVACHQGDYAGAQVYHRQSLRLWHEIGNRWGESRALNNLGNISNSLGNHAEARAHYEQSLHIKREIGDRRGEAVTLNNLGNILKAQGEYTEAWAYYEQSLYIKREIGDRQGECITLGNLGTVSAACGDYVEAKAYFEQSLCISRDIGDRWGESEALGNLGLLFHQMRDNEVAQEYSQQAVHISADIGARAQQGYGLTYLGHALTGLGHLTEATDAYQRALDLRRELGQHNLTMEPLAGLARIYLAQGDLAQAQKYVVEILNHLKTATLDGTDDPIRVYLTCYHVLRAGQDPRALDVLTTAYNFLQERAAKTSNEQLQRSFLENVPSHQELLAEWAKVCPNRKMSFDRA